MPDGTVFSPTMPAPGYQGQNWMNPTNGIVYAFDGTSWKSQTIETVTVPQNGATAAAYAAACPVFTVPAGETWTLLSAGIRFGTAGGASLQCGMTFDASGVSVGAGTALTAAATLLCGAGGGSANTFNAVNGVANNTLVGPGVASLVWSGTVTALAAACVGAEFRRLS